ncbi:Dabb family protein [Labedella phragmitis]|uniref:Dabb family protein n=1 Tax=Labedella phragmitis TaxID=2498849 RepID=A0A3S4DL51_9MICO|nr:Dabb family protein [Labedella phragmitis]RWZ50995.1 Dabb family protein [Labedella phragmitis]
MTIRHIVTWKLAATDPQTRAEHAAGIAERLTALVGVVEEIRSLSVATNEAYPDRNWDVVLVSEFDDLDALDGYQKHPAHQEAAAYVGSVVADRASIDYTL